MSIDDFRNEAASKPFDDEEAVYYQPAGASTARKRSGKFLGMTSIQRFVLVFLLMLTICVIGPLCLLATGRIAF